METSISDSSKEGVKNQSSEENIQDCYSCKMIGSTSLVIASLYVFGRGLKARMFSTRAISAIFGSSLGYTGLARFFDWYPFDKNPKLNQPVQSSI